MPKYSAEAIARFEEVLRNDPNSQVFAPLADSYCEEGRWVEAEAIAARGIKAHPRFAGGWVAWGKVLKMQQKYAEAIDALNRAVALAPENLMAMQTLGETLLELKKPKDALKVFKKILFINPMSEKAKRIVAKLETLSADEYEDDVFALEKLTPIQTGAPVATSGPATVQKPVPIASAKPSAGLERMLSLIDAFIVRNDIHRARALLDETRVEYGDSDEILKRQSLINKRHSSQLSQTEETASPLPPIQSREEQIRRKKVVVLKELLGAIQRIKEAPLTSGGL